MKFLVSHHVSIQTEGIPNCESVLLTAVHLDEPDMLQALLKTPRISVNVKTEQGTPLLHKAVRRPLEFAEMLLAAGADPNMMNTNQRHTPLLLAASENREDVVRLLLRYGADVNLPNCRGESPLLMAVFGSKFIFFILWIFYKRLHFYMPVHKRRENNNDKVVVT